VRFFLDNCVSPKIARALAALDARHSVVHLQERFSADVKDVAWICALRSEGEWIIVSGDPRIAHGKAEREAWKESKFTAFFLEDFSQRGFWVQAREVVKWWPDILEHARAASPGTGYLIPFNAKRADKWKKIFA